MKTYDKEAKVRILLAAKKLFAQQGFEGTTVRKICREAQSNIALVSYHFGGKESMLYALFDEFFPSRRLAMHTDTRPLEGLRYIVEQLICFKLEHPDMVRIIQQEVLLKSCRVEVMRTYIFPVYRRLAELLEEGKKQKLFHFESMERTLVFIMSVVTCPLINPFCDAAPDCHEQYTQAAVKETLEFILQGLGYIDSERKS